MPKLLLYSILGAVFLIYLPYGVVAYNRIQVGVDLGAPRTGFEKLPPYAQRAFWAHQNSLEAFMIFAASALTAYVTGVDSMAGAIAAIAFLGARVLYSLFYIINFPIGRSLMFGIGSLSSLTLFILSLKQ